MNIILLGSPEDYSLLKNWTVKNLRWPHHIGYVEKDRFINPAKLVDKFNLINQENAVHHFLIDSSQMDSDLFTASINWAENKGARIHLIQRKYLSMNFKLDKHNKFGPFAVMNIINEPLSNRYNRIMKILFDYIITIVVLLGVFWWFYLLVGFLIKISGKGPILIHQERIGSNGIQFECIKFRTMIFEEPTTDNVMRLTEKNDKRITWIGKILRKTNLDELPQLINVLMGQMSVVGPRPHMVDEDTDISDKIKRYRVRRFVKPGITGLAAINGYRGGTNDLNLMQERINYDIKYIEEWSLWLDLKIIITTLWKMITFNTEAH